MRLIILLLQFLILNEVFAQEICNNGIDDDGDLLIDCFDSNCSNTSDCENSFFGKTAVCTNDGISNIKPKKQWFSGSASSSSNVSPVVGDLNNDGFPEIVSINELSKKLFVLNGQNGEVLASIELPFRPSISPLIADIGKNGIAEIFINQKNGSQYAMYTFDNTSGILIQIWGGFASMDQTTGILGIADFDRDGNEEIYYKNEIIDASNGDVLIEGSGNWLEDWVNAPLAIDILPDASCTHCDGLELVTGNEIWAVNIEDGSMTLAEDMDNDIQDDLGSDLHFFPKVNIIENGQWSAVSSADYNLDGNLDLLITGTLSSTLDGNSGESTVFLWDVSNGTVNTFSDPSNDSKKGAGRVAVGDLNQDGSPNAVFTMGKKVYALDESLEILWSHPLNETHSAATIFDLNGDSKNEVYVKDGSQLYILAGEGNDDQTTNVIWAVTCNSNTEEESIIIADVDNDGSVEICSSCSSNENAGTLTNTDHKYSQIRVYKSDSIGWVPGRTVWNQYNYYNVNINDDLTVPLEIQNHGVVFSVAGTCEFGDGSIIPFDTRPLNTFGSQSKILSEEGCDTHIAADLAINGFATTNIISCVLNNAFSTFELLNIGDKSVAGPLPISYYWNDPNSEEVILLDVLDFPLDYLEIGNKVNVDHEVFGIPDDGNIYVVINDDGNGSFDNLPYSSIRECSNDNNIASSTVNFQVAGNQIFKRICEGDVFQFGSQNLTESGEYTESFPNGSTQCQEVTLTLEVESLQVEVTLSEGRLSASASDFASFQWIDCDTGEDILLEDRDWYTPSRTGNYAVRAESSNCKVISDCVEVEIVLSNAPEAAVIIYPNPVFFDLNVTLNDVSSGFYKVVSLSGKTLLHQEFKNKSELQLPFNNINQGVYILELVYGKRKKQFKIYKTK